MLFGYICAFLAAFLNGLIGIFSVKIIDDGLAPYAISFYKCLIAFVIISLILIVTRKFSDWWKNLKSNFVKLAFCAFCGFFLLYYFETNAYKSIQVPVVVFILLAVATIVTFIITAIANKRMLYKNEIISCLLSIIGLAFIFDLSNGFTLHIGILYAVIAGCGYGLFLSFASRLKIGSGLIVVNSLMLFGSVYLGVIFLFNGAVPIKTSYSMIMILGLAILPTIGGFWFTTKALSLLKPENVQLCELSEPLFSIMLSLIFLHQTVGIKEIIGGAFIVLAIYINSKYR